MIRIKKIAVMGSGTMGSGIACHLANAGYPVLLLDIAASASDDKNEIVNNALQKAIRSNPAPLFKDSYLTRIETGNFDDDLDKVGECDWIIEAIVENEEIKHDFYEKLEPHISPDTIISSNTSGIPITSLAENRSESFAKHFCGTHFFNPARYLPLMELIPHKGTSQEVIDTLKHVADYHLGKTVVLAKDSPAFIANRIGVYAMGKIFELAEEYELDIKTVDKITGRAIGRPKSGTFRLSDVVGLDVAMSVIDGLKKKCPKDKEIQALKKTKAVNYLMERKLYGEKSGIGFYKKTPERDAKGKRIIEALNLNTLEYEIPEKSDLPSLSIIKQIEDPEKRIVALYESDDAVGKLIKHAFLSLFSYTSKRIPEISEDLLQVDRALKSGFGWDYGVFEYWEMLGLVRVIEDAEAEGYEIARWAKKLAEDQPDTGFFRRAKGTKYCYRPDTKRYTKDKSEDDLLRWEALEANNPIMENDEMVVHDAGDGVMVFEMRSANSTIGEGILNGLNETLDLAEKDGWQGIIVANQGNNFSVGANLMLIGMMAFQQEYDQLDMAVRLFQRMNMRCRYSPVMVMTATQGYVFGGGCEMSMHSDGVFAAAESYIGLVEAGVGLLPGAGGTKEFALRLSDLFYDGDVKMPRLIERFKTLATGEVATSAARAFDYGFLQNTKDRVVMRQQRCLIEAKKHILQMAPFYVPPIERKDIQVLGNAGLAALYVAANELKMAGWASAYDIHIAKKIAWVICGGDLPQDSRVSEQYLLDLEREAFLSLCGEQKTMERIQHMLEHRKPLRN